MTQGRLGTHTRMSEGKVEWPTVWVALGTYALWALATTVLAAFWLPLGIIVAAWAIAQYGSLTHEVTHGHPFKNPTANAALVAPALTLYIPYARFRDTHLDHHFNSDLTDPYDDPESNYLDPAVWAGLSGRTRSLLRFNNTLLGRLLVGPVVGQVAYLASEMRAIRNGDQRVIRGWLWHIPALVPVFVWLSFAAMPIWAYLVAAYIGIALLKVRSFLEHRAHEDAKARTVIIEDRGLFALLFLNNNFHVVHHLHPKVPWYQLPGLYARAPDKYLTRNDGYRYGSYAEIFRRYFLRAKDPVPHPLASD